MLEHILIIALFTLGYCCTFWPGMIFERIGDYMEQRVPDWVWKPLGGCYICACMWVGSIVYMLLYSDWTSPYTSTSVIDWFITCVSAMGVNAFVSFISTIGEK